MYKKYISLCKMLNTCSVVLLLMCASPMFFYGTEYNTVLHLIGIISYGVTLRYIGTDKDKLLEKV